MPNCSTIWIGSRTMLSQKDSSVLAHYLASKKGAKAATPHSETLIVYSLGDTPFAYLETGKQLLRLSLRSDPELSKVLREKYEEVLPGQKLNPKVWNTIVLSGQLKLDEVKALIDHSYHQARVINEEIEEAL